MKLFRSVSSSLILQDRYRVWRYKSENFQIKKNPNEAKDGKVSLIMKISRLFFVSNFFLFALEYIINSSANRSNLN